MAIMLAGAGGAYLNGGLGVWEFVFTTVVTYRAYQAWVPVALSGGRLSHMGWESWHRSSLPSLQ